MRGWDLEVQTDGMIRIFWTSARLFKRVSRRGSPNWRVDLRFLDFIEALRGVEVQTAEPPHAFWTS